MILVKIENLEKLLSILVKIENLARAPAVPISFLI